MCEKSGFYTRVKEISEATLRPLPQHRADASQPADQPKSSHRVLAFPQDRQRDATVQNADPRVDALLRSVTARMEQFQRDTSNLIAIMSVLLGRLTDASHMSVEEIARFKHVTQKTVRNWIADGKLTRELIPGTRQSGVPTREVFSGWIEVERAEELLKKIGDQNDR